MDEKDKIIAQLRAELDDWKTKHESCMIRNAEISKSLQMLEKLIDLNPFSIQIMNSEGREIRANDAHRKIFEAKPKNDFSIFSDTQLIDGGLKAQFKKLRMGKTVNLKPIIYNPGKQNPEFVDKDVYVRAVAFPVFNENDLPDQYVLLHEDITERKRLKELLKQKRETLLAQKIWMHNKIDKDRKTMGNTIHKTFGHKLTEGKIKLENVQCLINDQEINDRIQKVINLLDDLNRCSQDLTSQFRQHTDIVFDFLKDLKKISEEFAANKNIHLNFEQDPGIRLSPKRALLLHNILEEALCNISRYANASNVNISLKKKGNKGFFTIIDDGIGISTKHLKSKRSFGLMAMREDCDQLGGVFSIGKNQMQGTEIYIEFPIKSQKNESTPM